MTAAAQQFPKVLYSQTQLGGGISGQGVSFPGGLDMTTPSLRLQPGALRDVLNFEVAQFGGYSRIKGYERVDGQASPSAATFTLVQIAAFKDFTLDFDGDFTTEQFTNVPSVGQIVTQQFTGATGTIIAVVTAPVPYLVLAQVTGVFDQTHVLITAI